MSEGAPHALEGSVPPQPPEGWGTTPPAKRLGLVVGCGGAPAGLGVQCGMTRSVYKREGGSVVRCEGRCSRTQVEALLAGA